jgi:hypothetical protein
MSKISNILGLFIFLSVVTACTQQSKLYQSKLDFLGDRNRITGEQDLTVYLDSYPDSREPMMEWFEEPSDYKGLEKGYVQPAKKFLTE